MKIEMTKCDHCGKVTEEAPLLIGKTGNLFVVGNPSPGGGYDEIWDTCGPACRIKLLDRLLSEAESREHVA